MRTNSQIYKGDEYHLRLGIYLTNSRLVKSHNNSPRKFKVALNKFACLTPTEYNSLLGFCLNKKLPQPKFTSKPKSTSIDWRLRGVVNPIKDQGQCGSCWAFSTVQTVESIDCISNGSLLSFSEQNLVDCCFACFGCSGGNPSWAISFIAESQGGKFNLESDYRYTAALGNYCHFDDYPKYGSVSGYLTIAEGDEEDLAAKVENNGPTSVSIDSSNWSFQLYESGIYDESKCNPIAINHSIGCVGFGVEGDTKYWILRNSWGTSWGEEGYMKMIWGNNMCGIASMALVAIP